MTTPGGMDPLFDVPETTTQTNTSGGARARAKSGGRSGSRSRSSQTVIPDPAAIFRVHIAGVDEGTFPDGGAGAGAAGFDPVIEKAEALVVKAAEVLQQQHELLTMQRTFLDRWGDYQQATWEGQRDVYQEVRRVATEVVNSLNHASVVGGGGAEGAPGSGVPVGGAGGYPVGAGRPGGGGVQGRTTLQSLRSQIDMQTEWMPSGSMRNWGAYAGTTTGARATDWFANRVPEGYDVEFIDGRPSVRRNADHPGGIGPISPEEEASVGRRAMRAYQMGRMTQGFMQGGAMGALRRAPVVGTAMLVGEGVWEAGDAVAAQRRAGAQFQQIYGGTNLEGQVQRLHQVGNRMQYWGQLGGEDAARLFQGVSELGVQGEERERLIRFGAGQYMRRGMDVETSLELMNVAAQTGNIELQGVSQALDSVAAAARKAGTNVGQATKAFIQQYAALAQTLPTGGGASGGLAATAGALTAFQASGGRALTTLDMSGVAGPAQSYVMAGATGRTQAQMALLADQDPAAFGAAVDDMIQMFATTQLDQQALQRVTPMIQSLQDAEGNLSPEDLETVGNELVNSGAVRDLNALQAMFAAAGVTISPAEAPALLARHLAGESIEEMAEEQIREQSIQDLGDLDVAPGGNANAAAQSELRRRAGGAESGWRDPFFGESDERAKDLGDYTKWAAKKGISVPTVEALLSKEEYDSSARFRVKTKQGGERIVDTGELVSRFADQLASGDAVYENGDQAGRSVAEALGVVDRNLAKKSVEDLASFEDESAAEVGKKAKASDKEGGGSTVRIEASDELKRWFRFNDGHAFENMPFNLNATNLTPQTPSYPAGEG